MTTLLKALCLVIVAASALVAEPRQGQAASAAVLEAQANDTLHSFVRQVPGARELANKAAGILVFPSVVKAGFGIGGEYGEGILLNQSQVQGYYNLISASFGFQLGVESRSVIIMFMTQEALEGFERRDGWKVGVDGSVTSGAPASTLSPPSATSSNAMARVISASSVPYSSNAATPHNAIPTSVGSNCMSVEFSQPKAVHIIPSRPVPWLNASAHTLTIATETSRSLLAAVTLSGSFT